MFAIHPLNAGEFVLEGIHIDLRNHLKVGNEVFATIQRLGVVRDGFGVRTAIIEEGTRGFGEHKAFGQAQAIHNNHLVTIIKDGLATLHSGAANDQIRRGGLSQETEEALTEGIRRVEILRNLIRGATRDVVAFKVTCPDIVATALAITHRLTEGTRQHEVGQVHPQLTRTEAAIHHVVRVVLSLHHRLQEGFTLGQVRGHGPTLDADNLDSRLLAVAFLHFHDIDQGARPLPFTTRERTARAADVHIFNLRVLTQIVEQDGAGAVIAQTVELFVLWMRIGFGEDGVEEEFALLHASTGEPFNLHEEFRRKAFDYGRDTRFIGLLHQDCRERLTPTRIFGVVALQTGFVHRGFKGGEQTRIGFAHIGIAQRFKVILCEGVNRHRATRKEVNFRIGKTVPPLQVQRDFQEVSAQHLVGTRAQRTEFAER